MNKYYILNIGIDDFKLTVKTMTNSEKDLFVQTIDSVRWNNAKDACVVKLKVGIDTPPAIISHLDSLTHAEVKTELSKSEWVKDEII